MKKLILSLALLVGAAVSPANAEIPLPGSASAMMPGVLNYQGMLCNPSTGTTYKDGVYTLQLRLYKEPTGGSAIWGGEYQVYVKGGYFNVMLGEATAEISTAPKPQCKSSELWKALWYTGGADQKLYLGVKPLQNANNVQTSTSEISPRQQLLSTPFAFRAVQSEYASKTTGDFVVPGTLTVNGEFKMDNKAALTLRHVTADSSSVKVGTSTTSPNETIVQGKNVSIKSGGTMTVAPGEKVNVNLTSNGRLELNNGDLNVNNRYISVDTDDFITMKAGKNVRLEAPTTGSAYGDIELIAARNFLGRGDVSWQRKNGGEYCKPILIYDVTVTLASNSNVGEQTIKGLLPTTFVDNYYWVVVGTSGGYSARITGRNTTTPKVVAHAESTDRSNRSLTVTLMGILKEFSYAHN